MQSKILFVDISVIRGKKSEGLRAWSSEATIVKKFN